LHALQTQLSLKASAGTAPDTNMYLRWRRSIVRLRQEIENAVIWSKRDAGTQTQRLSSGAVLALRILGSFHHQQQSQAASSSSASSSSLPTASGKGSLTLFVYQTDFLYCVAEADVYAELLSILRSKDVSGANVRKIYQYFQRWVPHQLDLSGSSFVVFFHRSVIQELDSFDPSTHEAEIHHNHGLISLLCHQEIISLLLDAFIHTKKQLPALSTELAKLLAYICSVPVFATENRVHAASIVSSYRELLSSLSDCKSLCNELIKMVSWISYIVVTSKR
jgi:hypothetical protein